MSKAFLRESDHGHEPEAPPLVSPLPAGARNYLTATGAKRLREELRRLRSEQRPALVARAANDRDAKAELAALDHKIRYLQQSLLTAEIVAPTPGPTEVVRFGTSVTVEQGNAAPTRYRLVGVDEADPIHGAVSWISPLAQALMNRRVGDHVNVATPHGPTILTIVSIAYDADG